MTPLQEIQHLNKNTPKKKMERLKPRRQRRQEERDRVKASKLNQKKIDRLSA
jgi:hypothetical protein